MKKILLSMALAFGMVYTSSAQTVLLQNFESGITPSWTVNTTGGGGGWVDVNTSTSTQLGTIAAHTHYALINEASSTGASYNNPATMTSPTFSLSGVSAPYLAYDYWYTGAWLSASPYTHEAAWIQISTDGGATYTMLDSIVSSYSASAGASIWMTKFVSLGSITPTANMKLQVCYQDHGAHIIGVAVDNILVYGSTQTDLGLTTISPIAGSPAAYFVSGGSATFSGTVTNYNSTTAVSSFKVYYQVGSVLNSTTISTAVAPLGTANFTTPAYTVASPGQFPVKIFVQETGDVNHTNDTMNTAIVGVPFMPTKRMVFEEATGTWCGWCVRGIVYMDSLWRAHSADLAIVSVHNSDPMQLANASTIAYDQLTSSKISGFPSMIIDRRYVDDPSGAFTDYNNDKNMFGYANIGLTTTTSGTNVTAHIQLEPAINMTGDYRLELVVTEDDLSGVGSGWDQHNYYSGGGSGAMQTVGYNFATLPNPITGPGVHFPFVARYTIPNSLNPSSGSPNGVAGSLPGFLHFGTLYTYDFAPVTLDPTWVAANLRYIVYLIDNNPANATYGNILNSATTASTPGFNFVTVSFVGVSDVNGGIQDMKVFPNPAQDDAHVQFTLSQASTVHFSVFDVTGREVFSAPSEQMVPGNHQINFSTEDYASGIYNVVISTENGKTSQRLSVIK